MRACLSIGILSIILSWAPAQAGVPGGTTQPAVLPVDEKEVQSLVTQSVGKVVLLNVWATWCVPCIEEFPHLLKLRSAYASRGLNVKFISIDHPQKSERAVQTFLKRMKVDFPTYIKSTKNDESFMNALHPEWSGAVPATFVYDRSGKLVHTRINAQAYEDFVALVEPLLLP
ncbi:MAG: thiol-disulfide oxidoreductase [Bacteroidetes bacterium]|nr:thiol-disulfide oxidoreductase [Bacteroidota bacterium]